MNSNHPYQYLLPDYWSNCKLLFLKDPRKLRADWIYGQIVGEGGRTPEEIAADFELPLAAVHEVIHYCTHNADLVRSERAKEIAEWEERDKRRPPLRPPESKQAS